MHSSVACMISLSGPSEKPNQMCELWVGSTYVGAHTVNRVFQSGILAKHLFAHVDAGGLLPY